MTAILAAAERDAREMIAAARREALAGSQPLRAAPPPEPDTHERPLRAAPPLEPAGFADVPALTALTRALEALSSRVSTFERAIDARLEVLWRALGVPAGHDGNHGVQADLGERAAGRAERLRAVDLALRGFSRAQIAAELRSTVPEAQIEQLLDDVLEHA